MQKKKEQKKKKCWANIGNGLRRDPSSIGSIQNHRPVKNPNPNPNPTHRLYACYNNKVYARALTNPRSFETDSATQPWLTFQRPRRPTASQRSAGSTPCIRLPNIRRERIVWQHKASVVMIGNNLAMVDKQNQFSTKRQKPLKRLC